jgi:hypothetical protein
MRRVVLILLLVALLPLRTWAADAMALHMAQRVHAGGVVDAAVTTVAHANCHEAQADATADGPASPDPCTTCAACQACFTVALVMPASQHIAQTLAHSPPHTGSAQFTSAWIALGQKPPIS